SRQENRKGDARRPDLAAGSRQVDPLPRLLRAPVLGQRDDQAIQARRAHLLSPEGLGRWQRRAELGYATADRGDLQGARGGSQERSGDVSEFDQALAVLCSSWPGLTRPSIAIRILFDGCAGLRRAAGASAPQAGQARE